MIIAWNGGGGGSNAELYAFNSNGHLFLSGEITPTQTLILEDLRDQDLLVSVAVDYGNTAATRLNGALKSVVNIVPVMSSDRFTIMAELDAGDTPGNYLPGALGEIIIYNRLLQTAEIVLVEQYLSNKWSIPLV